jgi:hypothetical protein
LHGCGKTGNKQHAKVIIGTRKESTVCHNGLLLSKVHAKKASSTEKV